MKPFALLFSVGLALVPIRGLFVEQTPMHTVSSSSLRQAKPDVPAQKVAPTPTPVAEPLPELLATKITLLQTQFQNLQLTLQATPAYKEFAAGSEALGKQMDALLAPYQLEHKCTVDQIAKVCLHKAEK